ncbi:T6SS effector BTH_I2691 family protein [Acinetobacter gandensis]|nr:T6SS effector BTH_I2691 family protein [Acinetobacter gandensis]
MGNDKKNSTVNITNSKLPMLKGSQAQINKATSEEWKKNLKGYGLGSPNSLEPKKISLDPQKMKSEVEKAGKNSKIPIQSIHSNKQNITAKQNAKECSNFCRESGFSFLPLRYSVASLGVSTLPSNLGKNVSDGIKLSNHKYTVSIIKNGYIYLYFKRKGKPEWKGYITKNGYNQEFIIGKKAPLEANNFACQKSGHSFKASLITVPEITPNDVDSTYIIYTHAPLTAKKRLEFENNADSYVGKGYWQKIDIKGWKGGNLTQQHCLSSQTLNKVHIGENSFGAGRWAAINREFKAKPKEYCAIALYDAIGITAKLNEARNRKAFADLNTFLNTKKNGISNHHRMQTINLIENIQKTVQENYIGIRTKEFIQRTQDIEKYSALDKRRKDRLEAARRNKDWETVKLLEKQIAETEQKRKENLGTSDNSEKNQEGEQGVIVKKGIAKGEVAWKKCQDQLDLTAIDHFNSQVDSESKKGYNNAISYFDDHYKWLTSQNLLNGLVYFDTSEVLESGKLPEGSNGFIFHAVVMDLMYGITFLDKGKELINSWLLKKTVETSNLFLRAYCFNNAKLIQNYNQIFSSDDTAKNMMDYTKQGFSAFVAADAGFDEWLSQAESKKYIQARDFKVNDKLFYWMSLALNSALKQFSDLKMRTVQVNQINAIAIQGSQIHISRLLYLKSGPLAKHIPITQLFYNVQFNSAARAVVAGNQNFSVAAAVDIRTKVNLAVKSSSQITKNRILAIVGIFEMLNFYFQYGAWQKDVENKPEIAAQLVGSSMSLLAVAFEAMGENFHTQGKAVASSATAFRIFAGMLGTIGGAIGLYVDGKNIKESNSKTLIILMSLRWIASLFLTVGQAGVLVSSVAPYIGKGILNRAALRFSSNAVVAALAGARVVASLTVFSVLLVGLEYGLKNYVLDNAFEDWCQKTPFRKANSQETPFKNEDEEYQEFVKAVVSV